jgi:hypothetical protein
MFKSLNNILDKYKQNEHLFAQSGDSVENWEMVQVVVIDRCKSIITVKWSSGSFTNFSNDTKLRTTEEYLGQKRKLSKEVLLLHKDSFSIRAGKRHRDDPKDWQSLNFPSCKRIFSHVLLEPNSKYDDCLVKACYHLVVSNKGDPSNIFKIYNEFRSSKRKIELKSGREIMSPYCNPEDKFRIFYSQKEIQSLHDSVRPMKFGKIFEYTNWDDIWRSFEKQNVSVIVCGFVDKEYLGTSHCIAVDFGNETLFDGSNSRQALNPGIAFELTIEVAMHFLKYPQCVVPFYPIVVSP